MAWRPNGSTSYRPSEKLRGDRYRAGEARLQQNDLQLTATGRALLVQPRQRAASPPKETTARELHRPSLDTYSTAEMADSARSAGHPYWHSENTFDMYRTTSGLAHDGKLLPEVLAHPAHKRAPGSARVRYSAVPPPLPFITSARDAGAGPSANVAALTTYREFHRVPARSQAVAELVAAGEHEIAAAAAAADVAARPLVTADPCALEFGPHRIESETAAEFGRPPARTPSDEAITFFRDKPALALNMSEAERARCAAAAPPAPQSAREQRDLHPPVVQPQTFRPVPFTGMTSTYAATHVALGPPDAGFVMPRSALADAAAPHGAQEVAIARGTAGPRAFGVPDMYRPSSDAVGEWAHDGSARPTTAPARAGHRAVYAGQMWRTKALPQTAARGGLLAASFGVGAQPPTATEYEFAYTRPGVPRGQLAHTRRNPLDE